MGPMDTYVTANALIEDDAIGVFDDSNSGFAAAVAAADLLSGWESYDDEYQQSSQGKYKRPDVDQVIACLKAWKAKGCPAPGEAVTRG